jgi:hypothetical protein
MHIHLSAHTIETGISTVGQLLGGAIGNAMETGVDGYETYTNIEQHNYVGAIQTGAETIEHGAETIIDGMSGDWL